MEQDRLKFASHLVAVHLFAYKTKNHDAPCGQIYPSTVITNPFEVRLCVCPTCGKKNHKLKKRFRKKIEISLQCFYYHIFSYCYHKKLNMSASLMNQTCSGQHKVCRKNLAIQPLKIWVPKRHIFSNFQHYNEYLKKSKNNDLTNNKHTS